MRSAYPSLMDVQFANFLRWCEAQYESKLRWRNKLLAETRGFEPEEHDHTLTEFDEYRIWQELAEQKKEEAA